MTALLTLCKDPYRPLAKRETEYLRPGVKLSTALRQRGYIKGRGKTEKRPFPYIVAVNGEFVLRKQWDLKVKPSDSIVVIHQPLGGNGGSNPLQIVAMVAIMVLAVYTGGAVGAAYGSVAGAAASAAVTIAGNMLISMLFPVKQKPLSLGGDTSSSPTYSFGAIQNQARLGQAIGVLYGRMRIVPDFAAKPYTEYRGNDQYLYQLFVITKGQCEIEQIRIDDADISTYGEVQVEIIQPGGQVTLFPDNVATSAAVDNLELMAPDQPGYAVLGPFTTNASGTKVSSIGIDLTSPSGVFTVNDQGETREMNIGWKFEYQEINDAGAAVGPWNTLNEEMRNYATRTAIRESLKIDVPEGRYQVRGWRTNSLGDTNRSQSVTYWTSLRGYLKSVRTYGNVTMMAVVTKATNNLNGNTSRRFNVIATRKLRKWDPVNGWTAPVATRSIAWAIADMITNTDYGRGLPDSTYNLVELYRLDQVWSARGDTFNAVFDQTVQFWDALSEVAACGRATPMYYAGMIDIIRNEPKTLPTCMFGPQNMIAGSFSTKYIFPEVDSPDHVVMTYLDEATWTETEVICTIPGETTLNPGKVSMRGITNRDQAWREGMSLAAKNRDQRRLINLTTGQEGLIPRYGDLAHISHDVVGWGYTGKVISIAKSGTTALVKLSEPVPFSVGVNHYIAFRRRNGGVDGPYLAVRAPSGFDDEISISGTSGAITSLYVSKGIREDLTQFQFGPAELRALPGLLMSANPAKDGSVSLSFTNYAESVYTAENGGVVPPPGPISNLPDTPVIPIIDTIEVLITPTVGEQFVVITPARGADYYEYQLSSDGVSWSALATTVETTLRINLAPGTWWVRARGIGRLPGPWSTWTGNLDGTSLALAEIEVLTATLDGLFVITTNWAVKAGHGGIAQSVELKWNTSNNLGTAVGGLTLPLPVNSYTLTDVGPGQEYWFWARVIDTAGRAGPWYNEASGVRGMATDDSDKIRELISGEIDDTWLAQSLRDEIDSGGGAAVEVEAIKSDLAAMYTIKTQLTAGGRTVMAGIGVGVENNEGVLESQVLIMADRFAIINPADTANTVSPFIIQGNNIYMASAFIQDGTITNAKIANVIQSNNYVAGVSGWQINKAGTIEINSALPGGGRLVINSQALIVYDAGGVDRVRVGYIP